MQFDQINPSFEIAVDQEIEPVAFAYPECPRRENYVWQLLESDVSHGR